RDSAAVFRRLVDPKLHRLLADALAEAVLPIYDGNRVVLEGNLQALVGEDLPFFQPLDVRRHANDAVRIVADQVGLDEMRGDAVRLRRLAAGTHEQGRNQGAK